MERNLKDKSHILLTYVTHFYCNQDDIDSVVNLLRKYETYEPNLLDRLQFVVVDDGSPVIYSVPEFNLNILWLKIREDIPWNNPGARNLGVTYAKSDKILLTDLDHEFPEETLRYILLKRNCDRHFFKIYRTHEKTGKKIKGHSNTFLMSRARFMRFFGYDEEFCGGHGSDDYRFVKIHKYHGSRQRYLNSKYRCYRRTDIDYSKSFHSLDRSLEKNTPIDLRKKRETEQFGAEHGFSRIFLNFTWDILSDQARLFEYNPKSRPLWKLLWYFRWIKPYR